MRKTLTAITRGLAVIAAAGIISAAASAAWHAAAGNALAGSAPGAVCTFDGGGTLTAGNAARTTDGNTWECGEDGTLTRLSATVKPLRPSAHPSLPSWAHWALASPGAARQVCGRGVAAITVWGGSGDTSAVVCRNGKAETS